MVLHNATRKFLKEVVKNFLTIVKQHKPIGGANEDLTEAAKNELCRANTVTKQLPKSDFDDRKSN